MAFSRVATSAIMACAIAIALPARAQDPSPSAKATARSLMDEANDRRDRGDLRGALESFRAAEALVRVPTTIFEVARTEAALGMLLDARNHLEAIVTSSPAPGEPRELGEAREAAAHLCDELDARIPSISVALEGDGRETATLAIDGEPIPRAARFVTHRVDPGAHTLVAHAADGREAHASITLRERDARRIVLTLLPAPLPVQAPAPAIAAAPPPTRPTPAQPNHTLAYASFGVGGAGLITGIASGIVAIAHKDAAAAKCTAGACPPSTYRDLDTASAASTVADIGFLTAGVGAAVGLVDLLLVRDRSPSTARSPRPFVGFGTVGVRGSF